MTKSEVSFRRRILSLFVGLVIVAIGAFIVSRPLSSDRTVLRVDGGPTFVVDVADEPNERLQGLSGRQSLGSREGMLFVFEEPSNFAFVMRDMNFPLDFVWIDSNKVISQIDQNVPHDGEPAARVEPAQPIQYVLEVNAGVAEELGWEAGQQVEFNR